MLLPLPPPPTQGPPPAPLGARGERPVFLPCTQTSGTWLQGILEIPGVQKVSGGVRCTWDIAWAVARLLRLPEPQVPTQEGPLPGLERYRALGLHEVTYPRQKEDILFLARRSAAILAEPMRCISGQSELLIGRNGGLRPLKLRDVVERFGGEPVKQKSGAMTAWRRDIETYTLSMDAAGFIHKNRIVAVHRLGVKPAFRLTTTGGQQIIATEDHAFSTPASFVRLGDLRVGDPVHAAVWPKSDTRRAFSRRHEVRIAAIEEVEPEEMFDLTMDDPDNNYVANDLVVHNSGKSLMALAASVLVGSRQTLIVCPAFARLGWAEEVARWMKEPPLLLCGRGAREARRYCLTCSGRGRLPSGERCDDCRARNGQSLGWTIYDVPELRLGEDGRYYCPRHLDVRVEIDAFDTRVARCRLCADRLMEALRAARYIIVNYELLVRQHMDVGGGRIVGRDDLAGWVDALKQLPTDVCIADESHQLRGYNTSTRRAGERRNERMLELVGTNRIPRVWMVSGTPFYGFVRDVFWPLEIATGGLWGSDTRLRGRKFMVRYCAGVQTSRGFQAKGRTVYAETELMRRLVGTNAEGKRNFDGLMIQRPREELFADVPPMRHQVVYLELDDVPRQVTARNREGISAAIVALNPLKLDAVLDRLLDELSEGNKIIVFTFHVLSAQRTFVALEKAFSGPTVRTRMQQVNARAWLATGPRRDEGGGVILTDAQKENWASSGDQRYRLAEVYRSHPGAGVLVATIDALPGALSLRGASSVHFLDLHWSPGAIAQAENRPWHPEVRDLQVIYYVVRDTVDEHVAAEVLPKAETLARMGREAGAEAMLSAFGRQDEDRTLEAICDRLTAHLRLDAKSDAEDDDAP